MLTKQKNTAKEALGSIIRKSRIHLYKPIQIAEILFHHRTEQGWDLRDLESYRNPSKRWRDEVSLLLVGNKSTSSQKYQDNVFDKNAIPPKMLAELGEINKKNAGVVEVYIYKSLEKRLSSVGKVYKYIDSTAIDSFSLKELIALFEATPGLRRSSDKMYEVAVYALFSSIVRILQAQVTLEIKNEDKEVIKDFGQFIRMVMGIDEKRTTITVPASLYRVGVTNAADKGLDMWANFGPAIQVKHLALTKEMTEEVAESIVADTIVIVCLDTEKEMIETVLQQVGWGQRIQGIITLNDLDAWYAICLSKKYENTIGKKLLQYMLKEFKSEFPLNKEIGPFMQKRGYDKIVLLDDWIAE